jgi:hypothetical protein
MLRARARHSEGAQQRDRVRACVVAREEFYQDSIQVILFYTTAAVMPRGRHDPVHGQDDCAKSVPVRKRVGRIKDGFVGTRVSQVEDFRERERHEAHGDRLRRRVRQRP